MPPVNERLGIDFNHVKCVIEALLITTDNSLTVRQIYSALGYGSPEIYDDAVKQLNFDYHQSGRSFEIQKIAGGYQIFTLPRFSRYVENLWAGKRHSGLSRGALETAAITAYRQPVTRLEIEEIRGVNCDSVLQSLLDKGLIKVTGRKKAPGRPILYSTTNEFLRYFGMDNLKDLPGERDFPQSPELITETDMNLLSRQVNVIASESKQSD